MQCCLHRRAYSLLYLFSREESWQEGCARWSVGHCDAGALLNTCVDSHIACLRGKLRCLVHEPNEVSRGLKELWSDSQGFHFSMKLLHEVATWQVRELVACPEFLRHPEMRKQPPVLCGESQLHQNVLHEN